MREQMATMELKGHDKLFAGWSASVVELARPDGSTLLVHLHRPPATSTAGLTGDASEKLLPLVLWLHGGGLTIGGAQDSVGATYATEPNPSPKPDLNPHPHPHPPPSPSPLTAHRSPLTFHPHPHPHPHPHLTLALVHTQGLCVAPNAGPGHNQTTKE